MESQGVELKLLTSEPEINNHVVKDGFPPGSQFSKMDPALNDVEKENALKKTVIMYSDGSDCEISPGTNSDSSVHAFSGLYAQVVAVIAAVLVFTELLHGSIPLLFFHGYLFTYLLGGGIICFIGVYVSMLADKCPLSTSTGETKQVVTIAFVRRLLSSDISIYLRIGVIVFGLGTLISNALEISSIFTMPHNCMDELNIAQPVLHGLFSILQLHFLFMNAREVAYYLGWFRHAALMHLVATNVSIWIRLMLWESAKDWLEATHIKHNSSGVWPPKEFAFNLHTLESDSSSPDASKHKPLHKIYYTTNCWWRSPKEEKTEDLIELHMCLQNSTAGFIWEKAMPYLYPFVVQYCLVSAGVAYVMWSNLHSSHSRLKYVTSTSVYEKNNNTKSRCCLGSTKGLFLGFLTLAAGIITLILFFVLPGDKNFDAQFVVAALRCAILGISAVGSFLGLLQIRKMSKNKHKTRLAELLQRTGMLAVYVHGICNMIAGGVGVDSSQHLLLFLDGTLMIFQACLQSLFIHQVLKKRLGPSNNDEKPGRNVVIFLVFSNMVLWLLESFTTQHQISSQLQRKFYGDVTWSVVSRIVLPLVIFYRFHSAAALMDAWHKSYKVEQN